MTTIQLSNSNQLGLSEQFQRLSRAVKKDVLSRWRENGNAFDQYQVALSDPLARYAGPRYKGTKDRYCAEVAALAILSRIADEICRGFSYGINFWSNPDALLYSWYKLNSECESLIKSWVTNTPSSLLALVDQASDWILSQGKRDHLGEFYTPPLFSNHLVDNLGVNATWYLDGAVIDPACGNGVLLGEIAKRIMAAVDMGEIDARLMASRIGNILCGFDVNPVAVQLTRIRLIFLLSPLLGRLQRQGIPDGFLTFPEIKRADPLADPLLHWGLFAKYKCVVGNPPFSKIIAQNVPFLKHYSSVLNGQANLYQLFLFWAIQALTPGGRMSFLVPQSFRSGPYFEKLRTELAAVSNIVAITQFADRYAFEGVDSPLMIITLEKKTLEYSLPRIVQLRVSHDGDGLHESIPIQIDQTAILRRNGHGPVWYISSQAADYDLLEKINRIAQSQPDARQELEYRNGGFVWNQHKELLHPTQVRNSVPLIYSGAIQRFGFTFPATATPEQQQRQYARLAPVVEHLQMAGTCVLVKRTTPKKQGHRVIAALLPESFLSEHPHYFVENHVNVIRVKNGRAAKNLVGVVGWLNSRLLSLLFQMMNGSAHLSLGELKSLPIPLPLIERLSPIIAMLLHTSADQQLWNDLNQLTYDFFDLTTAERTRVDEWIV